MERKKGIPLVAIIIFVVLLVAIVITCTIILRTSGKENNTQNTLSFSENDNQVIEEPKEETGEEIDNEDTINRDEEIQQAYKLAGNGKTFAKYAIYATGGFDTDNNNLDNTTKLQLAMSYVTNSDMDQESATRAIKKETVENYAKDIFETTDNIEYTDFTLYNNDTNFTENYKTMGYVYNEENETYEISENDVDENTPPQITEVVTKAVKYSDKIEIYVKPLFIKTFYSDEIQGMGCEIFGNYDFQNKEYPAENSLIAIAYKDYEEVLKSTYEKDIDKYKFKEVQDNLDLNKISEYKYTFIKTESGYKIKSLEKTKTNEDPVDETPKEMTAQEKQIFNSKFEEYVGESKTGTEAQMIIDEIINSNNTNKEDISKIINVTIDNEKLELEGDKVENLNELITSYKDKIDTGATYSIKANYKSGLITTITLTQQ